MDTEIIISLSSVGIACIALFIGVWQGFVTRQHNRLSVRPHLRIDRSEFKIIKITLHNTGIGPAFIDDIELKLDDEVIIGDHKTRMDAIIGKLSILNIDVRYGTLFKEEAITAGEEYILLEILTNPDIHDNLASKIGRITYSVKYKSVYGERFKVIG